MRVLTLLRHQSTYVLEKTAITAPQRNVANTVSAAAIHSTAPDSAWDSAYSQNAL